jgi:putative PIN family toxin of toxin-antitoxin system
MGPSGPRGQLIFDRGEEFVWITSAEIVAEYLDVLSRPELLRRFQRMGTRRRAVILAKIADSTRVHLNDIPHVCRDPHDDMFLATAVAGAVDYIVSEDLDLLSLGAYEGIPVCTTQTLIDIMSGNNFAQGPTP